MDAMFCPDSVAWGDVGTWVAGIGTLITAGAALWIALRNEWKQDERRARDRKEAIFHSLMAHRRARYTAPTLQALNSIDMAFGPGLRAVHRTPADAAVYEKWQQILVHVGSENRYPDNDARIPAWNRRMEELYFELLEAMSKSLGLAYTYSELIRGGYIPESVAVAEEEGKAMRKAVLDAFAGEGALRVIFSNANPREGGRDAPAEH
jgi:hypothetical protein